MNQNDLSPEVWLKHVAENVSDNIWILRISDMQPVYVSPSSLRIFGFTPEESLEMPLGEQLTPESMEVLSRTLQDELALEGIPGVDPARSQVLELQQYTKNGDIVSTEVRASFLRDAEGSPVHVLGITRDISMRKEAQEELRRSEEKYRHLVEQSKQGLVIAQDDPVRLSYVNSAMETLTGYRMDELLSFRPEALTKLIHRDDRERFFANFKRRVAGESIGANTEYRLVHRNGSIRFVEIHGTRITFEGAPATQTIFLDVTARIQEQEERKSLEEQLHQSQKMEAVGRLAGGVAHDFNNLLTAILGNTSLANEELDDGHPAQDFLDEIEEAAVRASKLVRQLLTFSRKQTISMRSLDLNEVVDDMQRMLVRVIGEDITLTYTPGQGLMPIFADKNQIELLLLNLATNARAAMPEGGRLDIETSTCALDRAAVQGKQGLAPGPYVRLRVQDSGLGMNDATLEHLFEPFFTTRKDGTGLGLSIVYGIIQQHGGAIDLSSTPGEGTVFTIHLPMTSEAPDRVTAPSIAPAPPGHETILVVEDEPAVRAMAVRLLERQGYKTLEAGDGVAALALLDALPPASPFPSLVFTDIVMPHMNGLELSMNLRAKYPDLKFVLTSGYSEQSLTLQGEQFTGHRFLAKPYSNASLTEEIRAALK